MIFSTGAFLRPIKVTQDGQELWMWTVAEFIDDSFKDGLVFNPPEISEAEKNLLVECVMVRFNLNKEWGFVCGETTQHRCSFKSKWDVLTRELLFTLQLILDKYLRIDGIHRRKTVLHIVYEKTKVEYLNRINQN